MDVYDPRTDAWKRVASMPTTRSSHAGVALNGKVYVIGGFGGNHDIGLDVFSRHRDKYLGSMDMYDPQSDSWQSLAE